ncbi:MAG: 4-hydroxythreonine-4-phosphate dehydrogenase [Elusimicrobia bacterium]|nr:4-hydroxythreonine-4-phosphate dehydrogenase [Elusimicrobiota bacterium]
MKPLLAFTSGDPGGIGPEVAVKTAADRRVRAACRAFFIGPHYAFESAGWKPELGPLLDTALEPAPPRRTPKPSARGGKESFSAVKLAVELALAGGVDGVLTAPISKQSWAIAKTGFLGHTEFLRRACKAPEAVMSFISGGIRCALVTEHTPVAKLKTTITRARVKRACRVFLESLRPLAGSRNPALGICSLNPHAGDAGEIGLEEISVIGPALASLRRSGSRLCGPLPPDAAWKRHLAGEWDGIVCMYHDQALIPLKTAVRAPVAHWTCGLPIVRTSPAHGTAFDIAGQNMADPSSSVEAALFAASLCRCRR